MRKPSVLLVHTAYSVRGGEDAVVAAESAMLRRRGHAVDQVLLDNRALETQSRLSVAAGTVWSGSSYGLIGDAISAFQPDVIHFHNIFPQISPAGYWAAAARGVPSVQTLHNFRLLCANAMLLRAGAVCEACVGRLPWRAVAYRCYRGSASASAVVTTMLTVHRALGTYKDKINRYIALNTFCRNKFIEGGLPAERIDVKPNFVEVAAMPQAGPRSGGLFVGRLSSEKGLNVLRAALDLSPQLNIDVIGTGPDASMLTGHARLRLLGWKARDEVYARMRSAAYLIVPSIWYETFGLVVVEAFACGLPVIASRLGALSELIRDRETGILFDPGSATSLAEAVHWAESHPHELRSIAGNARAEYEAKYTEEVNYAQLLAVYERARESVRAN